MGPAETFSITAARRAVLERVASRILELRPGHPTRVGIDGVDAAGKTTLADQLVEPLAAAGRHVVRASIDGFHNPRQIRHRRGSGSPEGYYRDSFDHEALLEQLLRPLGPGGARRIRGAVFDFRTDRPTRQDPTIAPEDAILVFDGVFLHRPELREHWDLTVFLDVGFETTVARASLRDRDLFGTPDQVRARYAARYVPGQELYLREVDPRGRAHLVIDNTDPDRPEILESQPPEPAMARPQSGQ